MEGCAKSLALRLELRKVACRSENEKMKNNARLIYDVGMHKGEDTEYYLARGFKVIAFEAEPDLVNECKKKFEREIKNDKLVIIEGAIVEDVALTEVHFFKNKTVSVWGTVLENWANRNQKLGAASTVIKVPVVNFIDVIKRFGEPYYLKIDIEGMDLVCLQKLINTDVRPKYISMESNKINFVELKAEFDAFEKLGYKDFYLQQQAIIQQQKISTTSTEGQYLDFKFKDGATGVFGNDLEGPWIDRDKALQSYRKIFLTYKLFGDNSLFHKFRIGRNFLNTLHRRRAVPGWYDTHTRR